MDRTFVFVSAIDPDGAARVAADAPVPPDLCLVSPTPLAHAVAKYAQTGEPTAPATESSSRPSWRRFGRPSEQPPGPSRRRTERERRRQDAR